jgi:hypothetical protein
MHTDALVDEVVEAAAASARAVARELALVSG